MDKKSEMGKPLNSSSALVLFSGGQDSTTTLGWALDRYDNVETVGFRYGQKHLIELQQRPILREAIANLNETWKSRLGPDHLIEVNLIGQLAGSIASPSDHALITGEGFAAGRRYIPGRNLIMLSMSASVAFRRDIRTLVCGASETEYSGYPDCRDSSMRNAETAISSATGFSFLIETPLMLLDKAGVWILARSLGGPALVDIILKETHSCYLGSRDVLHEWGYGCGSCEACQLRQKGWQEFLRR